MPALPPLQRSITRRRNIRRARCVMWRFTDRTLILTSSNRWSMGKESKPGQPLRSHRRSWLFMAGVALLLFAGATAAWSQQAAEGDGIDSGNYNIKQSVEFGYRFTD